MHYKSAEIRLYLSYQYLQPDAQVYTAIFSLLSLTPNELTNRDTQNTKDSQRKKLVSPNNKLSNPLHTIQANSLMIWSSSFVNVIHYRVLYRSMFLTDAISSHAFMGTHTQIDFY